MAHVSKDEAGNITGFFNCPQPDAKDADGNVICQGTPTVEIADDDPALLDFLGRSQE